MICVAPEKHSPGQPEAGLHLNIVQRTFYGQQSWNNLDSCQCATTVDGSCANFSCITRQLFRKITIFPGPVCFLPSRSSHLPLPSACRHIKEYMCDTQTLLQSHLLPSVMMLLTDASPLLEASLITSFWPRQHFLCVPLCPLQLSPTSYPCKPFLLWDLAPCKGCAASCSAATSSKYIKHLLWYLCNHTPYAFQKHSPSAGRYHCTYQICGSGCGLDEVDADHAQPWTPLQLHCKHKISLRYASTFQKTTRYLKNYFFHCKIQWSRCFFLTIFQLNCPPQIEI